MYAEIIFVAAMMTFSSAAWPQNDAPHIFQTVCAECHGADGSGHTPKGQAGNIPDMRSAEVQKRSDADLTEMIINGKRSSRGLNYSMPSNRGKLSDQQVKGLVGYIRGLAKK
jgi:mono/diheme cytochrome c family protein